MTPSDPFHVVRTFERRLASYTGARYAVTVNSCTAALFLSFLWWAKKHGPQVLSLPARTYVSVPMVAIQAGHKVRFIEMGWKGWYEVPPTSIMDSAPMLSEDYYEPGDFVCVSFHPKKPLGLANGGGAILHDNAEADEWFRRIRFDGRTEGKAIVADAVSEVGYHCYMFPATAAEGLHKLSVYKERPVEQDNYPDLRLMPVFQNHPKVVR